MSAAELTIVIPARNNAGIIRPTLDSVAAQTLRPLKVILVDNGSTDGTLEEMERWRDDCMTSATGLDITILKEPIPGASRARNTGLAAVNTPWTMFFDSDDIMLPDHAGQAMETAKRTEADIIGWDMYIRSQTGGRKSRFMLADPIYNNVMHSTFSTLHYMAKTDLFRAVGGWNEETKMFDDAELGLRLLNTRPLVAYAGKDITVIVRQRVGSLSQSTSGRLDSMLPAWKLIHENLPESNRHWADLMVMLLCRTWARDDSRADSLARQMIARQPWRRRMIFKTFDIYTRLGGRGVARIYHPLSTIATLIMPYVQTVKRI